MKGPRRRRDDRPLDAIASEDAHALYVDALAAGDVRESERRGDSTAYAVCKVENGIGDSGWVVLSATGHSWEGIEVSASMVFDTEDEAVAHASDRFQPKRKR